MASEIQICNMALSRVGAARISALTDPTKEARECKLFYALARDATLEAHDWTFARKRQVLAQLADTYSGWSFAYQLPTDCAVPREIFRATPGTPIKYEVVTNPGLSANILLTDEQDAELIYTAKVTDTNMFSAIFTDALAWRLGGDLAYSLLRKETLQQKCMNAFYGTVASAAASNANADNRKPVTTNPFVEAR